MRFLFKYAYKSVTVWWMLALSLTVVFASTLLLVLQYGSNLPSTIPGASLMFGVLSNNNAGSFSSLILWSIYGAFIMPFLTVFAFSSVLHVDKKANRDILIFVRSGGEMAVF